MGTAGIPRAMSREHSLWVEVGLGEGHQLAYVLIPQLELDGTNTVSDRHRRDAVEDGVVVVGALQVVVRDPAGSKGRTFFATANGSMPTSLRARMRASSSFRR